MNRPPRARAVRLWGENSNGHKPKAPRDSDWPNFLLTPHEYSTWSGWFGIRTGKSSHSNNELCLWVVDFDLKEHHAQVLKRWESEHGMLPGWRVRTGSGGLHVYMAGPRELPPRYRIPNTRVTGELADVEVHANPASQVVWHSTPGYRALTSQPSPLPKVPSWLDDLAVGADIRALMGGGGSRPGLEDAWYRLDPRKAVEAILGAPEVKNGRPHWRCPEAVHGKFDKVPSLECIDGRVVCHSCGFTGRLRAVVGAAHGLGERSGNRWISDGDARETVKMYCRELGAVE